MVVNYKLKAPAQQLFFLASAVLAIVGPLWWFHRFGLAGIPTGYHGGRLVLVPLVGLVWIAFIARNLLFNARVRREPRAMQWDGQGITLWRNGRATRFAWPQVGDVSVREGEKVDDPHWLEVMTNAPGAASRRWRLNEDRLQLADQSLPGIARSIEQARADGPRFGIDAPDDTNPVARWQREWDADKQKRRDAEAAEETRGVIFLLGWVMSLGAMALYRGSLNTTVLTPPDPRLWIAATAGFVITCAAFYLLRIETLCWNLFLRAHAALPAGVSARPGTRAKLSAFFLVVLAGMVSGWVYYGTDIVITATSFSGRVEHRMALLAVEQYGWRLGRPVVVARLRSAPDPQAPTVRFGIQPADEALIERSASAGRGQQPWCLAAPVEVGGRVIRAEVIEGASLPAGSIRACP